MKITDTNNTKAKSVIFAIMDYYGFPYEGNFNGNYIWEKSVGEHCKVSDPGFMCTCKWVKVWLADDKPIISVFAGYNSEDHNRLNHTFTYFDPDEFKQLIDTQPWIWDILKPEEHKKVEWPKDLIPYKELFKSGIRHGDIVAEAWKCKDRIAWNFMLLRSTFPKYYDTSLCCSLLPTDENKMHLSQIGFHWCGSTDSLKFRKATDEEKKMFIDACISRLHTPVDPDGWGWGLNEYAQIIGNMQRDKLLTKTQAKKLSKELVSIHGVNLLKLYQERYGY